MQNVYGLYLHQRANALLDWMTDHHLPLSLFRESNGDWVVVDASIDAVLGSGASAYDALVAAHEKEVQMIDDREKAFLDVVSKIPPTWTCVKCGKEFDNGPGGAIPEGYETEAVVKHTDREDQRRD